MVRKCREKDRGRCTEKVDGVSDWTPTKTEVERRYKKTWVKIEEAQDWRTLIMKTWWADHKYGKGQRWSTCIWILYSCYSHPWHISQIIWQQTRCYRRRCLFWRWSHMTVLITATGLTQLKCKSERGITKCCGKNWRIWLLDRQGSVIICNTIDRKYGTTKQFMDV